MKRRLLVMRHAKADRDAARWQDFDRPLNERGQRDAPRMGKWLASQKITPDKIICSPALRTKQTAELVAVEMNYRGELLLPPKLYEGSVKEYLTQIRLCAHADKTVLIVGHNPTLESLVEQLCGEFVHFPTGAVAELKVSTESWDVLSGDCCELLELWSPKTIDD